MREIEFRGKYHTWSKDKRTWMYGYYDGNHIVSKDGESRCVDIVCQYTGQTDVKGTKIFEGDVVSVSYYGCNPMTGVVKYSKRLAGYIVVFSMLDDGTTSKTGLHQGDSHRVLGNIFDDALYKGTLWQAYFLEE